MLRLRKIAVLGAGVMGAQIAAHLVNADIPVILFDMPATEGNPNAIVLKSLEGLKKLKPSPLAVSNNINAITPANYQQHLDLLKDCDVIVEAVAEQLPIKQALYQKIIPFVADHTYIVSNTSGLSIEMLADSLPEHLRKRFCGMHFFNPPRYMHLVELIPHRHTDNNMLENLEIFLVSRLGKGVIHAKDTPNFIANRVGVFSILSTMFHAEQFAIPLEVVDALTGPLLGRAKSATFRTADVVGLDTFGHVINTLVTQLPDDPWIKHYQLPAWLQNLIQQKALGQKTGKGIYTKIGKDIQVWDIQQQIYRLADQQADTSVIKILKTPDAGERLNLLRQSMHPQAQFLAACIRDLFHYCAFHLSDIAESVRDVDLAIRWGFGWQQGPFELWQSAGWKAVSEWLDKEQKAGKLLVNSTLPKWVLQQSAVYQEDGAYSPTKNRFIARSNLPVYQRQRFLDPVLAEKADEGKTIFETATVRCWHDGDGVAILSFKTKMNTINEGVLDGVFEAIAHAEKDFKALVLWQRQGDNFSLGANLAEVDLAKVEPIVEKFQRAALALRYANIPIVAAIQGMVLGGGCELSIHCARIVAAFETYIGLPEVGVGLLPAGGGCKEFALRAVQEARGDDPFKDVQQYFKQIAMAEISTSAPDAKIKGYLRPADVIVMHTREVLWVAKQHALALAAAYYPPLTPHISVIGKSGIATLMSQLVNLREGNLISDHDYFIASKVAEVICGGQLDAGTVVDQEWYLRLERQAFVALAQTEKTQARIKHTLTTGKPLRN